jgi:maltose alpha-D-glucosyltransferase/alpha-amylase
MKYRDLPTKEGGYHRTGTRTPMQWDHSAHMGFSDNPEAEPYLPLPDEENAVTVEDQLNQPHSLLNTVKELIVLRHRYKYLQADALFEPVNPGKEKMPFVYRRGSLILAVNPSGKRQRVENSVFEDRTIIYKIGKAAIDGSDLIIDAQSFMICK